MIAIESFFDGGAEMFAIRLANELALTQNVYFVELYPYPAKEKRQLSLLDQSRIKLFQPGKNFIGDWLDRQGMNEKETRVGRKQRIMNFYRRAKKRSIVSFIKKHQIDVVNSHSWDTDVYFAELKKETTFKLVSSFHGHYEFLAGKRANYDADTASALKGVDTVIYTSPKHRETLDHYGFPAEKRRKIFYGVSMPLAAAATEYKKGDCLQLVMAARPIKEKGWEEAIQAVLSLQPKYPGVVKLNLVGGGEYLDEMASRYRDPAINFAGYKDDVRAMLEQAHIGLLPSYYIAESLPNTIIEYLFCGKPVITTDIGAIREMISTGVELAGVCIELHNGKPGVELIAEAIEQYLGDPALVKQHSDLALKAAEKFTMETCIEEYLHAFNH